MVRAILFDLDGTLWDCDSAVRQLVDAHHAAFPELQHIPRERYIERVVALDAHGLGDKNEVYRTIVSEFDLPVELAPVLREHFWTEYWQFCEPLPDVVPALHQLASLGVKLGIITNGATTTQKAKILVLGLETLMDVILISEREGVRKPDPAIFQLGLSRLGVTADAAWFVGDSPDADVRGACEAGLTAVWRKSWAPAAPHATHVIDSLEKLVGLPNVVRLG